MESRRTKIERLLREPFESLLVKPFILGRVHRPKDVKV
jgi:hypothetical protein